jgi:hypothetical protein
VSQQFAVLHCLTWTSKVLVVQTYGIDAAVHQQETRLADPDALTELRGGLEESCRPSVVSVLAEQPVGQPFRTLVTAACGRQRRHIDPGTIRTILSAGDFEQRNGRRCAAAGAADGARSRRHALLTTIGPAKGQSKQLRVGDIARAVRTRLHELQARLPGDRNGQ